MREVSAVRIFRTTWPSLAEPWHRGCDWAGCFQILLTNLTCGNWILCSENLQRSDQIRAPSLSEFHHLL